MKFSENGVVAGLSPADQADLFKRCKRVDLQVGQRLHEAAGDPQGVYFLTGASVALVVRHGDGPGLALGLSGHEGVVGLQLALGLGTGNIAPMVQSAGEAWVAHGPELQRLVDRRSTILLAFSRYLWTVAHEIAMHAAFAQLQDIRARVAGWILISAHRCHPQSLTLTHVQLASMLGVRRSSVTLAAMELKERGLLDYRRGQIRILDQPGLEALSCWVAGRNTA